MAREPGLTPTIAAGGDDADVRYRGAGTVPAADRRRAVVLAERETVSGWARLLTLIDGAGATVMQATPATWRLLLRGGLGRAARSALLCGGEALPRELADQLLCSVAHALWNMYGPTETTIWSSDRGACAAGADAVPIGTPIANTQLYVLDAQLQPVPIGVAGELYIGGAGWRAATSTGPS